jgi:UDP-N-acetylmuramate: L-alanyl-gamma-D-glutamyl-meso-diaminopimelate ligase
MLTPDIRKIHLIGICGTGMASLAAMLKEKGYEVTGSDEGIYPPMSDFLAQKEIPVSKGYAIRNLQSGPDLIIVGNALSRGNCEIEHMLNRRMPYLSFPESLKHFFLRDRIPIVVTGTHGKTTTTSMIAWTLQVAGLEPDFLIGGIAENFRSSYGLGGGKFCVVEGDEYDSAFFDKGPKFLHYLPYVAVVGNIEFDHADIYRDLESIKLQFSRFVHLIPEQGFLAVGGDSVAALEVCRACRAKTETFGMDSSHDWCPKNIEYKDNRIEFDILYRGKHFCRVGLGVYGSYNIRNALAAVAILNHLKVPGGDIRRGLETFSGVRRRLQLRATVGGIRIYEDFAHHPTAVRETLHSVRESFDPKRLWAIYEPRSATSRRKVFQQDIARALGTADCIAVASLFKPEKVPDEERLDLGLLVETLRKEGRSAWNPATVEGIINKVCEEVRPGDIIVIMSNGGFGDIYTKLPTALERRFSESLFGKQERNS